MATFLQHTLSVLSQTSSIDRMLVISGDPTVWSIARDMGALAANEGGTVGLNLAVTRAVGIAEASHATAALILPADLPFIEESDVGSMLRPAKSYDASDTSRRPFMVICPDQKVDGTNALLVSLVTPFSFHYGQGSFRRHLEEAALRGLASHVVRAPHLEFDLDTEDDWRMYQQAAKEQPFAAAPHRTFRL